jgi:hypothetical protein
VKYLLRFLVCIGLLSGSILLGQTPSPNAIPFIDEVTPASATLGSGNLTLTLAGANFSQNATVILVKPGAGPTPSTSTTVNPSGTQIVAFFSSPTVTSSFATLEVTVQNASGATSNIVSVPVTYPTQAIGLLSNSNFQLSNSPEGLITGDFNGDGIPDLASIDLVGNTVSILLGYGNGFLAGSSYPTGNRPRGIVTGDFNGDGKLDLAIANSADQTLTILLGNGDGTFTPISSAPPTGAFPTQLVAADFNGDGKLDLAVVNLCGTDTINCPPLGNSVPGTLTILLGNGDGTFTPAASSPSTGNQPSYITAGDFNSDGLIDLAVSNAGSNSISILMGNGDGKFTPATTSLTTASQPQGIVTGDFNGDGALDLAVVTPYAGTFAVFLNQGCAKVAAANCTFAQRPFGFGSNTNPVAIATADMNGDGILDIVTANTSPNSISVMLGDGSGMFTQVVLLDSQAFNIFPNPNSVVIADFNGDGRLDVAATGTSNGYPLSWYSVLLQSPVASVTLTPSSGSASTYGQQVQFTATISGPSGDPAPTGTVIFSDGGTTLFGMPLMGNQAVFETSTLGAGAHQISATYNGDANYVPRVSNGIAQTVLQAQSTTNLISNPNPAGSGQPVQLMATIQSAYGGTVTGTVNFTDLNSSTSLGTATVSNGSAQISVLNLAQGTHQITATYGGDSNSTGSQSATATQTVNIATTMISLNSSLSSSSYSQAVTITATVQPSYVTGIATGTVSFYDGGNFWQSAPVLNNTAQITVSGFAVGAHSLSATYSGDSNFTGSSAAPISLTVSSAATTTVVTSNANPSVYGQSATFTATVNLGFAGSTPSGAITIFDGTTVLYSGYLSGGSAQVTVNSLLAGTHSITAQYAGSANFTGSTSAVLTQTVNQAASLILASSNVNPASFGQPVTFNATIQTTTVPSGTVTFLDNGVALGTVTLPGNTNFANFTAAALSTGSHSITASYSGDSNFTPSTSAALTETVNPASSTIPISSSSYSPAFGQSITLTASVKPAYGGSPTGTITFVERGTSLGVVALSNSSAQLAISTLATGSHYISAQYSGDTNFAAGVSGQTLVTVSPPPTTTVLTSSANPSSYNQPVTLTATLQFTSGGTPTGSVAFYDGASLIGSSGVANGSAQLTISGSQIGTHSFTATYGGDTNFSGSTSAAVSQVVNPGPTTATVTSNYNPAIVNYNVTFTVNVYPQYGGTPTGLATLFDGSTSLGSVSLTNQNGQNYAQFILSTLAPGTHSITAKYNGSAYFAASTSAVFTETVNLPATSTYLTSSVNPAVYGQTVSLVASVQPPGSGSATGTVAFFDGSTLLGTVNISNNTAQFLVSTLSLGSHALTGQYSGDAKFAGSTSAPVTETINPTATTTTVSPNINPTALGQSVIFTAVVQPSAGGGMATGSVTFLDGATSLGTAAVSNNAAQLSLSSLSVGSHSITAKYSGDGNFTASTSAAITQTVNQGTTTTTLGSNLNPAAFGQSVVFTASVQPSAGGSMATGTVTFLDGATSLGVATVSNNAAQLSLSSLSVGSHSITAKYSGDGNFTSSTSVLLTQSVNRAATATTVAANMNPEAFGQSVIFTAAVQPSAGGTPTGTVTLVDGTNSLATSSLSAGGSAQFTVGGLAAGSHSITVVYAGDANFTSSTSAVLVETLNPASTTTTIGSSANPSAFDQTVIFTASVQLPAGTTAAGTVAFMDGSISLGSMTLSSNNSAQLTLPTLSVGTHSITAVYAGTANLSGSTSSALNQVVNGAATTTALISTTNSSIFGQSVTLSATVQTAFGGNATGTVTFLDATTSLGTASVSSNAAQISLTGLSVGSHSITAKYSGDSDFTGSASSALVQTVSQASTTTTLASNLNPAVFGQSVTFTVTVQPSAGGTPSGTVTLMDGTTSLANGSLSGEGNAQFTVGGLSTGSHSITAVYGGDANFTSSTSLALVETMNAAPTTTTITSSANPSAFDQTVTFTAAIQCPAGTVATGSVTFMDGSTSLGSATVSANSAQVTVSALTVGTHTITAVYTGNANLSGSTSAALSQVVNGAATTTTVTSSSNPSTFGQSVILTATIQAAFGGGPTGTVTFLDGTTSLGTASVSSNASQLSLSGLSAGSHSIAAKYSGDTNFSGSTSTAIAQTVNPAATTTTLASSTNPSAFGQTVTFAASVQPSSGGTPTGNVTFFDGSVSLGSVSLSGSSAQLTLASLSLGSHSITAKYNGDSNYTASSSAALAQSVTQSGSSTTLISNANPSSFGQPVTFSAVVQPGYSGTPTGTVTFFDGGTSLGSIGLSGGSAQLTLSSASLGSHSISAKYNGDPNFTASTSTSITQSVTQAATATHVSSNANPSSYGQAVTLTATVTPAYNGTPTGTVSFFDGNTSLGNANLSGGVATYAISATALTVGSHSISARYNGDSNFLASSSAGFAQVVNPAATVTTLTSSANPSAAGKSVTFTAHSSSSVSGTLTGTVNFYLDGSTAPAASASLSSGSAQYATNSLSAGDHSVVAAFVSTKSIFNGSTSTPLTQAITDFSISASPASDTIARGSSGTYALTLTPIGGLTGNVSLSCNGAPGGTTCSISPSQVTLNGTSAAQATVTIAVATNASTGAHTLTLKGTLGSVTHSTSVSLTIN